MIHCDLYRSETQTNYELRPPLRLRSLPVGDPSSVGESRCKGDKGMLPTKWVAGTLGLKLGVSREADLFEELGW